MHTATYGRGALAFLLIGLAIGEARAAWAHGVLQQAAATTITGQVTNAETGDPLPGVNVRKQGTDIGTATDGEGRYSLEVAELEGVLVFSFIGYDRQEISIEGRTTIDVVMAPQSVEQEEIVVTAFGIERAADELAYSTTKVEGAEVANVPENNLGNALKGKVAGVNVTDPATGPGGSSRILIRGAGSLAGNNQPLYVVDGMPIDNTTQGSITNPSGRGHNIDRGNGLGGINPEDIESINVLKGGPAAALYGSRASNGVILITTKKGRAQEGIGVEFSSSTTFSDVLVTPDWQYEYGQGYSEGRPQTQAEAISSGRLSFGDRMDGEPYVQFDGETRPYSPQRNNVDRFFRTGTDLKNSLALTGGSEAVNYRFSVSNTTSNAIVPNSSFAKNIVRGSANATLGERLNVTASAQYNVEEGENRPKVGYADRSPFWGMYMLANTVDIRDLAPGYDENGNEIPWNSVPVATNPYFVVNKYRTSDQRNRFIGQVDLTYDLFDNLFVRGQISEDYSRLEYEGIEPIGNNFRPQGNYESEAGILRESNMMLTLNYDGSFLEDFGLSGMVGGSRRRNVNDQVSIAGSEYTLPNFYSATNLASTSTTPLYSESGTNSLFGSVDLSYRDLLFLTVTGRQDWFSTLNPESNGIFYPSIGGSFVVSDAVDFPGSLINYLKVRASWAQVGGSSVAPYIINQTFSMLEGGHNGRPVQTISSDLVPNPGLTPLTSTSYEGGFDAQFLNYLVDMNLTFYSRKTTDDIVQANIASSSGYSSTLLNVGEVRNRGVELMLSGTPFRDPFGWEVSYNMAYNQSEVLRLAEGLNTLSIGGGIGGATIQHVVGRPYGAIWGYEKKRNEEGQIIYDRNSGYAVRSDPLELGQGIPPLSMGLTNTFDYKSFSLGVQIDGKFGGDMYSNFYQYAYRFGKVPETLPGRENGLTVSGVDQNGDPFEKTWAVSELDTYYDNDKNYTSLFVFDNTHVKLRQVTLTYRLPVEQLNFISMQSASVSLIGSNLAILYKAEDQNYFDPESSYNVGNAQGLNAFSVPGTRTVGVNLRVRF